MADSRGNESTAGLFARLAETVPSATRGPWGQAQRLSKALGAVFGAVEGPCREDGFTIRFPDGSEATWRAEGRAWEETKSAAPAPAQLHDLGPGWDRSISPASARAIRWVEVGRPTGDGVHPVRIDFDAMDRAVRVFGDRAEAEAARAEVVARINEIAGIRDPVLPSVPASLALIDDGGA